MYKPTRPSEKNEIILKYTRKKLPAFFEFAKDKTSSQVEQRNLSTVNKIYNLIPNPRIYISKLNLEPIDYKAYMMINPDITCSEEVKELYKTITKTYGNKINFENEKNNVNYVVQTIRDEFLALEDSVENVCDMLVSYCYGEGIKNKEILWLCFGNEICDTLKQKTERRELTAEGTFKHTPCRLCGKFFKIEIHSNVRVCENCKKANEKVKMKKNISAKKREKKKAMTYNGLPKLEVICSN